MELAAGARKLVGELVKGEQMEVRRAEIVSRDLAKWAETASPLSGAELATFLADHAQVTDLFASTRLLDELIEKYLTEPRELVLSAADIRNPALEAELVAHPGEVAPFAVYADFLQQHGDPLGEWIALGIRADQGGADAVERFDRYRTLHDARVFGGLGAKLGAAAKVEWRFGMIRSLEQVAAFDAWPELFSLRICSVLERVSALAANSALAQAIVEVATPTLRTLTVQRADADKLELLAPSRLVELSVSARGQNLTSALPSTLERLVWRVDETHIPSDGPNRNPVRLGITELRYAPFEELNWFFEMLELPALRRLELELERIPHPLRDVPALLGSLAMPITELVLCAGRLDPAMFAKIAALPIATRITKLGLTELGLTDEMLAAMTPGEFTNLTELDVSFNELTGVGVAHAKRFAPTVISTRQHKRGSGMEQRVRRFAGARLQPAELISDPKHWKRSGIDGDLRWARYSGEADYELYISKDLARYACSCPSSIQPCKHVIALALVDERMPLRKLPPELGLLERVGAPRD